MTNQQQSGEKGSRSLAALLLAFGYPEFIPP